MSKNINGAPMKIHRHVLKALRYFQSFSVFGARGVKRGTVMNEVMFTTRNLAKVIEPEWKIWQSLEHFCTKGMVKPMPGKRYFLVDDEGASKFCGILSMFKKEILKQEKAKEVKKKRRKRFHDPDPLWLPNRRCMANELVETTRILRSNKGYGINTEKVDQNAARNNTCTTRTCMDDSDKYEPNPAGDMLLPFFKHSSIFAAAEAILREAKIQKQAKKRSHDPNPQGAKRRYKIRKVKDTVNGTGGGHKINAATAAEEEIGTSHFNKNGLNVAFPKIDPSQPLANEPFEFEDNSKPGYDAHIATAAATNEAVDIPPLGRGRVVEVSATQAGINGGHDATPAIGIDNSLGVLNDDEGGPNDARHVLTDNFIVEQTLGFFAQDSQNKDA